MPKTYDLTSTSSSALPRIQLQASHEHRLFEKVFEHSESLSFQQDFQQFSAKQKHFDISRGSQLALAEDNTLEFNESNATLSLQHSNKIFFNSSHAVNMDLIGVIQADESIRLKDQQGPGVNDYLRQKTEIELNQKKLFTGQIRYVVLQGDYGSNLGLSLSNVQKDAIVYLMLFSIFVTP